MPIYFDNAATTPLDPRVFEAMQPWLLEHFGNPSSIHQHGRKAKAVVEQSRKAIAGYFNTSPSEVFFTSGGTEADNMVLRSSVESLGVERIITSTLEHHAVLHTAEALEKSGRVAVSYVENDEQGRLSLAHLEELLKVKEKTLVSIMHGNNEIGNLNDIEAIGDLCRAYGALFHSDTVQTVGHYPIDLQKIPADFIVGSAHKFHGPKGVGFLYINARNKIAPLLLGGAQERNMRGGTENVAGIVGMARAFELAYEHLEQDHRYVADIKQRMVSGLTDAVDGVWFNGLSADPDNSLYTVLNVGFPESSFNEMLIFNLDIHQIAASAGSACSSGTNIGSHVLKAIGADEKRGHVRFSFSRMNTREEADEVIGKIKALYRG